MRSKRVGGMKPLTKKFINYLIILQALKTFFDFFNKKKAFKEAHGDDHRSVVERAKQSHKHSRMKSSRVDCAMCKQIIKNQERIQRCD